MQRKPRVEMILKAISAEPGCSQSRIAEYAKISSGTVARDVAALERRTLVTVVRSIMTPDINQDICFDIGDILKVIEDQFSGALKQKLVRELKHIETIETALLSESALAKDWLTPEEDEAWKDL